MPEDGEGTGSSWLCHCEWAGRIRKEVNDRRWCPLSIFASNSYCWVYSHTQQQLPSFAARAGHIARYLLNRQVQLDAAMVLNDGFLHSFNKTLWSYCLNPLITPLSQKLSSPAVSQHFAVRLSEANVTLV